MQSEIKTQRKKTMYTERTQTIRTRTMKNLVVDAKKNHCGKPMTRNPDCPAWGDECRNCGLPNHWAIACEKKCKANQISKNRSAQDEDEDEDDDVSKATGSQLFL